MLADPVGGVYKKLVLEGRQARRRVLYGDTVDGAWYFKLLRDGRSVADIRDHLMFGESNLGDTGHQGQNARAAMAGRRRSLRLQRRVQGHDRQGDQGQGPVHARRGAQAHEGVVVVRLVHRPRRADPDGHRAAATIRRRRSRSRCAAAPTARTRKCARRSASRSCCRSPTRCAFLEWRTPNGCATCRPALNYYLISTWPKRSAGRSAVALHQRARARQHPEGRHVLGDPADVGRRDQRLRAAAHRRRRRQVPDPDGEGDRRPAHRPARREEGRTCRRCGATSTCRRATRTRRRCAR